MPIWSIKFNHEKLNDKDFYDDESSVEVSELKYLKIIREIRDEDKDLFSKIKEIEKKARTEKITNNNSI